MIDLFHPVPTLMIVFSIMVPLAIVAGRYAVRSQRQHTLNDLRRTLENTTGRDAAFIPSFEFALQKYDLTEQSSGRLWREFFFYFATAIIFAMLSATGFKFLLHDNGSIALGPLQYEWMSYEAMTVTVVAFSFLGAYIWSIRYLIRRIANFDLSPMSFLRASAQIILACATAVVVRHLVAAGVGDAWAGPVILLPAFMIGFFPDAGLDFLIRKVPQLRLKAVDPEASNAMRAMPVEMIDGIDSQVSFRLAEREIVDVENLATENPVLLCAETPYPLLEVLDWIAQAQLALEVGPKAYRQLRDMGIRTIFALEKAVGDPQLEPAALKALYGEESDRPKSLAPRLAAMKAHLHVARLDQVWRVATEALAVAPEPGAGGASAWTTSSLSDQDGVARTLVALSVDSTDPSRATKPIEALMKALDIEPVEVLKGADNGALAGKLSTWVERLCGIDLASDSDGAAGRFAARAVEAPWIMSGLPHLERYPLLVVVRDSSEVALGRHPGRKPKADDAVADGSPVPLLVVARRQGLVVCGTAKALKRALDEGLRERLLASIAQEPTQPARTPEDVAG